MDIIKKIISYFVSFVKLLWSIIAYIPTFFIRALTLMIIIIMTVSFFSKINHTIGEGTALLIPNSFSAS